MNFGELTTYTRQRLGIEQNLAIADTELQMYLNMSLANLDMILCNTYNDYKITTYLATAGATSNLIPLPPDFLKLRAVDYGSPAAWVTVYGFGLQERNHFNNPIGNMFAPYGNTAARKVRVMGNNIVIEPQNIASGNYQIWYTPKYKNLVNPTDDLPTDMDTQGWIEYAVASSGVKIYNKLLLSPAGFIQEVAYYEKMVRDGAQNRMSGGPKCVQNVRNIGDTTFPFSGQAGYGT
jgi:hypothetical protein